MKNTAILLIHCPDVPGIIAEISNFITVNKGNIIYLDQYVDHANNAFFMRVEWDITSFLIPKERIGEYFGTLYGQKYDMQFRLYFAEQRPRMAIFVSKMSHCLYDMLARWSADEWNVDIPLIISNHEDLRPIAEKFGIAYHVFPITKENKAQQEAAELEAASEQARDENVELEKFIDSDDLKGYMEMAAIEDLNYAYPNERRFYDTSRN